MTAWLLLLLLIAVCAALLWLLNVRGAMLQIAAASLLAGAAGYALQGRPGLPGAPARTGESTAAALPLQAARHAFFGQFTPSERWLIISDSYARRGNTADSVGVLESAVREHPHDAQLWVGLGNALVEHGRMITPPAEIAYARAAELAPGHPAPAFFYGLALARSGDPEGALTLWRQLLANAAAEASWRPLVEDSVAALEGSAAASRPGPSPSEAGRSSSTPPPSTDPGRTAP